MPLAAWRPCPSQERNGRQAARLAGDFPGFSSTVLKVIVPWYPGLRYEDFASADLKPGVAALKIGFSNGC